MTSEQEERLLNEALVQAILHGRAWEKQMGFTHPSARVAAWETLAKARGVEVPPRLRRVNGQLMTA